jgi:hypothetical protein
MSTHDSTVGSPSKSSVPACLSNSAGAFPRGEWYGDFGLGQKFQDALGADRPMAVRIRCTRLQQVLAVDAATGVVYEPELEALLENRSDKKCAFRVTDAGFSSDRNVVILIRAKFFTPVDVDEAEADVPAAKRCKRTEETWSFNYATGETKEAGNTEPLHLFKKFLSNGRGR